MPTVFIAGDVVNHTNVSGMLCEQPLAELVQSANYSICNFEAPVHGIGSPQPKSGPHLSQRKETLPGLKAQGFDLVQMANNHIMDHGPEALSATLQAAAEAGLETTGAGMDHDAAYKPLVKNIEGVKVGFINGCEAQFGVSDYYKEKNSAGYAWINHRRLDSLVLELRDTCDYVIVLAHAGLENYDIPQREWRERYKHLCDLGADAVVGSHPHVPQGYEEHNGSLIFYSLGNFYFDTPKYINREDATFSVMLHLARDTRRVTFEPLYHYKAGGLVRLSRGSRQVDLNRLCASLCAGYEQAHDAMSMAAYEKIKSHLRYSTSPFPVDQSLLTHAKHAVKWLLGHKVRRNKDILLLHMLRNEAYYFAARQALDSKYREMNG